jgi:hypothetical protein
MALLKVLPRLLDCNDSSHSLKISQPIDLKTIKQEKLVGDYNFIITIFSELRLTRDNKSDENYNSKDKLNKCNVAYSSHLHLSMSQDVSEGKYESIVACGKAYFDLNEFGILKLTLLKDESGTFKPTGDS